MKGSVTNILSNFYTSERADWWRKPRTLECSLKHTCVLYYQTEFNRIPATSLAAACIHVEDFRYPPLYNCIYLQLGVLTFWKSGTCFPSLIDELFTIYITMGVKAQYYIQLLGTKWIYCEQTHHIANQTSNSQLLASGQHKCIY